MHRNNKVCVAMTLNPQKDAKAVRRGDIKDMYRKE